MAAVAHISTQKFSLFCSPMAVVEAAIAKYSRYRLYRQTLTALSALTGRELADLGLHRSMLQRVAYESAYQTK